MSANGLMFKDQIYGRFSRIGKALASPTFRPHLQDRSGLFPHDFRCGKSSV